LRRSSGLLEATIRRAIRGTKSGVDGVGDGDSTNINIKEGWRIKYLEQIIVEEKVASHNESADSGNSGNHLL
jgi:hypothetical protein